MGKRDLAIGSDNSAAGAISDAGVQVFVQQDQDATTKVQRGMHSRFAARGRLAPDGLRYVNSWVTQDRAVCYQVMEADDPALVARYRNPEVIISEVAPPIA